MTIRALIEALEEFDKDAEVMIGMIQNRGSNFAMEISGEPEELTIDDWECGEYKAVILTEGEQIGTVNYDGDEDDDDEY